MSSPLTITGAVLTKSGGPAPYAMTRPLELWSLSLERPRETEVLVRIEAAGVCHSDLSVVNGDRHRPVPMLMGHEASGVVEEVGAEVSDLTVGQRVVATFLPHCGWCAGCLSGGKYPCSEGARTNAAGVMLEGTGRLSRAGTAVHHHLGVSGFATHAVMDRSSVVAVDDDIPADVAALLGCAVLTGGGAVMNVRRPVAGERVVVVGLGGVGMAALLVALALPDVEVIGVDAGEPKLAVARDLGASSALAPHEAIAADLSADLVIEAAGNARAFETAVGLTGIGGTTVTVGLPNPAARASISPLDLVSGGRQIVGSYLGSAVPARDIPTFAAMWRVGRLPIETLVSGRIALADINEAMDRLASGLALRQIIEMS